MTFKKKTPQAPPPAPLEPRPPEGFPVTAPPGFALTEKHGGLLGGRGS